MNEWEKAPSVLALGMFDGLHIGHRQVIGRAIALARMWHVQSVVYTFENHPRSIFAEAPQALMSAQERARRIKAMGVDVVDMHPFDRATAALSPDAFIDGLCARYAVRAVVVGSDYTYGYRGAGTVETLRAEGARCGFQVCEVPFVTLDGEKVSSTRIRTALSAGDEALVRRMMGKE